MEAARPYTRHPTPVSRQQGFAPLHRLSIDRPKGAASFSTGNVRRNAAAVLVDFQELAVCGIDGDAITHDDRMELDEQHQIAKCRILASPENGEPAPPLERYLIGCAVQSGSPSLSSGPTRI